MKNFKLSDIKILFIVLISFVVFLQGIFLIPPLDRDESRFAASTKNMIESENYIDIQLENVPRYKKPIGIYWVQAIFTKYLGTSPYDKIWTYRVPSLVGLILSIVLIYFCCRKIFNHEIGILSVFFLSTSLLFISEIHQAKTDGFLFLFISLCNLIILDSISNLKNKNKEKEKKKIIIYWVSMAIGVLIKGPIIIIFTILPLIVFSIISRNIDLLRYIHSPAGYFFFFFLVSPWFILITIESNGTFWYESVVNDLLKKVSSGQESHGFPPGYYTILLLIFFWPGCIFLIDSFRIYLSSFKKKIVEEKQKLFLFCCFFPCFFIFELIPTKLPHYVFPSYLSLSILISIALFDDLKKDSIFKLRTGIIHSIYPITFISIFIISIYIYSVITVSVLFVSFMLVLLFFLSLNQLFKKSLAKFLLTAVFFQISVYLSIVYILNPHLNIFWISKNINQVTTYEKDVAGIYHFGYNEPSLIFLMGHKSKRLEPEKMLKKFNSNEKNIFILTEQKMNEFSKKNYEIKKFYLIKSFKGFNYSQGKYLKFYIFKNYAT